MKCNFILSIWNFINNNAAVIIACCALLATIYHGIATRKHYRLSVKPHLVSIFHRDRNNGNFKFEIINSGLGPALLTKLTILLDGTAIEHSNDTGLEHIFRMVLPNESNYEIKSFYFNDYSLPKDNSMMLFNITLHPENINDFDITQTALERLTAIIHYESIYKDNQLVFNSNGLN